MWEDAIGYWRVLNNHFGNLDIEDANCSEMGNIKEHDHEHEHL